MDKIEFMSYLNSVGYREDEMTCNVPREFVENCVKEIAEKCGYETLYVVAYGLAPDSTACLNKETLVKEITENIVENVDRKVVIWKAKLDADRAWFDKIEKRRKKHNEYMRQYRAKKRAEKSA